MSLQQRLNGNDVHEPLVLGPRLGRPDGEAPVDRFVELRAALHRACVATVGPELKSLESSPDELRRRVQDVVETELARLEERITTEERQLLVAGIVDDVLGYGPIEPLLHDASITEIMVNGHRQVFVERQGKLEDSGVQFASDEHLMRVIDRIVAAVGRRVDEASPMVDARLADGSRVNVIIPPLALHGPVLTIRKFSTDALTADDLVELGSLTADSAAFLHACVCGKLNVLISGGTGVGKTTLLNALSSFIPSDERIITIEDAAELHLQQRHVVSLEARPANIEGQGEVRIRDLVRNALRMRPDRIVIGEVRGPEAVDMLQAMNTGHEGSLTTIHANTPRDALSRLETCVLTAGVDLPLRAIREQISSAFDVVVQLSRLVDGTRRVTHITEVLRMESDVVTLQDIFLARPSAGKSAALLDDLQPTGLRPSFGQKLAAAGVELPADAFVAKQVVSRLGPVSHSGRRAS
jgi:pilus assembly protein CpaF